MTRYVVIGAGAVGATTAAQLHLAGKEVVLAARGAHLAALKETGLRYVRPDGTTTLRLPVVGNPDEVKLRSDDFLVLATKTQDADAALAAWAWQPVGDGVAATELPVLTVQNGLDSERSALRRFATVFGAVSWSPASHVAPGEVVSPAAPVAGVFWAGRYPSGTDPVLDEVAADFAAAGLAMEVGEIVLLARLHGREAPVNLISGGSDAEQARQGDYLPKDRRYARTSEFIDLLRRAWTEPEPFSHDGEFYKFDGFGPGFAPYDTPIPISIGGQSDEAFQIGGEKADVFSFWGEPLDDLRSEIERVHAIARAAGRTTLPRIWVTFRPIVAKTDELAWRKAHEYVARIADTFGKAAFGKQRFHQGAPQNVGSQRALSFAERSELYDRALWTRTAAVTNAAGASTALVGSPETVAAAILDYVDRGADLVSIRGYDTLADAVDHGRHILPLVQQELAHREATGRRGTPQAEHLGNYAEDYRRHAEAGQA